MTSKPIAPATRTRIERVRAFAEKHWLGVGLPPEQQAAVHEIRHQYVLTAQEYYRAGVGLYDSLGTSPEKAMAKKPSVMLGNRNVQLFLAYSMLWEAFNHVYTAAAYTDFARHGAARAPNEEERDRIARVLTPPIMPDDAWQGIKTLRNGETPAAAVKRLIGRSSRELRELYGVTHESSLTDLHAFLQGAVRITEAARDGGWERQSEVESWVVQPLDDDGRPIDPDAPFSPAMYRSVVKWDCYQIRKNVNFLGKSDGSIDDAILIIRAFSLVAPLVHLLLDESRRSVIFAL